MDLESEQKRLENISEAYRKDANKILSELPRHLILTSTIFIALSSSIFGIEKISETLSIINKWLLISSLGFMVISIFIGLMQYIIDYKFFKSQVDLKEKIINAIYKNKFSNFKQYEDFVSLESENIKTESCNIPLIMQSIFILLGVIAFLITIYCIII